jgi:hypothetical protein
MIQIVQRKSDNKYLQSIETDTWVDNASDAFEMSLLEYMTVKTFLSSNYSNNDLKVIVNVSKMKEMSKQDKKEIKNLFKK